MLEVAAGQGEPEYQVENVSILLTIFKQLRIKLIEIFYYICN